MAQALVGRQRFPEEFFGFEHVPHENFHQPQVHEGDADPLPVADRAPDRQRFLQVGAGRVVLAALEGQAAHGVEGRGLAFAVGGGTESSPVASR
jgi:hypothetical protein